MSKNELITAMSEASGLPKKDCETALNAFTGVVENALKAEDKVQLVGFGSFEVKARAARTGRNPRTKEPVEIAASKAPVFKAGKALKDAIQEKDLVGWGNAARTRCCTMWPCVLFVL